MASLGHSMGHHQPQNTPSLGHQLGSHSNSAIKVNGDGNSAGNSGVPTPIEGSVNTDNTQGSVNIDVEHPMDPMPLHEDVEVSQHIVDPRVEALRTAASKLYRKYLRTYAPNEINISAGMRREFDVKDHYSWNLDFLDLV